MSPLHISSTVVNTTLRSFGVDIDSLHQRPQWHHELLQHYGLPTLLPRDDDDLSVSSSNSSSSLSCSDSSFDNNYWQSVQDYLKDEQLDDESPHDNQYFGFVYDDDEEEETPKRPRMPNRYAYVFGDPLESNYYQQFLSPAVRERTYEESNNRWSDFRSHFRLTLEEIDTITTMFLDRGWVQPTKRCQDRHVLYVRTQLLVMSALEHLASRKPFRQFKIQTNLCNNDHRLFFDLFVNRLYEHRSEWISYPNTMDELKPLLKQYQNVFLPGCGGSIDVVHCRWSQCPAGDYVKAKGKEDYASIAFECISDQQRRVLGVSPAQFGSRNDKHIVRLDDTVTSLRKDWYKNVVWRHYDLHGNLSQSHGVYLICDGGYLRWKTLVCPFSNEPCTTRRGYFSSNLESVRKDVECTFGILKKRWRILDFGLHYRDLQKCEKIFNVCCILHNMHLDNAESGTISRGARNSEGEMMFLEAAEELSERTEYDNPPRRVARRELAEAEEWLQRRDDLAEHIEYCRRIGRIN